MEDTFNEIFELSVPLKTKQQFPEIVVAIRSEWNLFFNDQGIITEEDKLEYFRKVIKTRLKIGIYNLTCPRTWELELYN
jgi:hypothetical protein